MPAPKDGVHIQKYEESASGGDDADQDGFSVTSPLQPWEDAPYLQGVFFQGPSAVPVDRTTFDKNVYTTRDADGNLIFRDTIEETEYSLERVANTIRGRGIQNPLNPTNAAPFLIWDDIDEEYKAQSLGGAATVANIQQLAVNQLAFVFSTTYQRVFSFIFGGTNDWGILDQALALTRQSQDGGGRSHDIRIQDVTNATTIAEVLGRTGAVTTIHDLGTISNLPAAQAVFELQIRRNGPSFTLDFFTLSLRGT